MKRFSVIILASLYFLGIISFTNMSSAYAEDYWVYSLDVVAIYILVLRLIVSQIMHMELGFPALTGIIIIFQCRLHLKIFIMGHGRLKLLCTKLGSICQEG